jgi:uncharacterized protein (TIGR04255 family)
VDIIQSNDKLPVRLGNCPIIDAVVEIRFTSKLFPEAVFGVAYQSIKEQYPKVERLPILDFPKEIVEKDPILKTKPQFKMVSGGFILQIGPQTISLGLVMPYPGWAKFFPEVKKLFSEMHDAGVIDSIYRLGIRYSNYFGGTDLFSKVNLEIQYNKVAIPYSKTFLRTELDQDGFSNTLQVSNSHLKEISHSRKTEIGSIIDIDTYREYENKPTLDQVLKDIEAGHDVEKKIFWNLLGKDLKNTLKPTF